MCHVIRVLCLVSYFYVLSTPVCCVLCHLLYCVFSLLFVVRPMSCVDVVWCVVL